MQWPIQHSKSNAPLEAIAWPERGLQNRIRVYGEANFVDCTSIRTLTESEFYVQAQDHAASPDQIMVLLPLLRLLRFLASSGGPWLSRTGLPKA